MTPRDVLLVLLRQWFPRWDIWICDRGVWRAAGFMLISASSVEGLLEHLAGTDPEAFDQAARTFAGRAA
ncbi:hypothetical protein GCM10009678_36490 [Actinomadura kijaniata]|uniref:Uncharacterized protein n=1 Tax=Actinomadura namibiensis TaxID=182080 RepID=A0A7W3LQ45_ACTNM|nr:hypothetical protein [Actinomadura namibiensis]MBA8952177.1 hypothetical protein [Actinomadura namibiensis]